MILKGPFLSPKDWETLIKSFLNSNGGLPGCGLGQVSWGHWGLWVSFRPHQKRSAPHSIHSGRAGPGPLMGVFLSPRTGTLVLRPQNELRSPHHPRAFALSSYIFQILFSWNPLVSQISLIRGQQMSLEFIGSVNEEIGTERPFKLEVLHMHCCPCPYKQCHS